MGSKIIKLEIENVMRCKAFELTPEGNLIIVGGKNGAGKTSVLNAIWFALGGKDAIPDKPINDEANRAKIRLETDDLIVTRSFTAKGTTLQVVRKDGRAITSPQTFLNSLVGPISFDPHEFIRLEGKKQLKTLKDLLGLDFTELDAKHKDLYEQRADVNRELKRLEGHREELPPLIDNAPEKEVSVSELAQELEVARNHNEAGTILKDKIGRTKDAVRMGNDKIADRLTKIENLRADGRKQIAEWEADMQTIKEKTIKTGEESIKSDEAEYSKFQPVDESLIIEKMENTEGVNKSVRNNNERNKVCAEIILKHKDSESLTEKIEAVEQTKKDTLTNTKFPVEGMSFDEEGIQLNGVPFSQASHAEALRVSVAMGLAVNPELKVLLVRDGSLLDDDSMKILSELAEENDAQLWIEKVGNDVNAQVIMEDGIAINQKKEATNAI